MLPEPGACPGKGITASLWEEGRRRDRWCSAGVRLGCRGCCPWHNLHRKSMDVPSRGTYTQASDGLVDRVLAWEPCFQTGQLTSKASLWIGGRGVAWGSHDYRSGEELPVVEFRRSGLSQQRSSREAASCKRSKRDGSAEVSQARNAELLCFSPRMEAEKLPPACRAEGTPV